MPTRTSRNATPTPLENYYKVGEAAVRLGFKTEQEHKAGSKAGERWLREGANRPEDGSQGEPFPHRRMDRYLMFSDSDLAYIAAMHFNAPTQGARRGNRRRSTVRTAASITAKPARAAA
jgi:hypothetical protein